MDEQGLRDLRAEVLAAQPPVAEIIEGLQHVLEQQDLPPEVRGEVQALLADYQRRESLMVALDARASATLDQVTALQNDGYPNLPEREIDPAVLDQLDQNRRTIELAQGQFRRRAITTAGTSAVSPEEPIP